MSMEISSNYKDYKNEYLDRVQTGQDKVKEASQDQRGEDKNEGIPVPKDEYISSEKSGSKPSGLYRLGQDENGNPKVMYDDPKRVAKAKDVQPKEEPAKRQRNVRQIQIMLTERLRNSRRKRNSLNSR